MFIDDFRTYKQRIMQYAPKFPEMTEEATKTALIMPFFMLLGYDVFDPNEILPEYVCDVPGKKGEKIDYAIMRDGEPIILVEAKRAGMKLQKAQQGQLYRYFSTSHSRIAVLTNGNTYNFYSDINTPNVMDDDPFLSFDILEDDEELFLSSLEQFHKDSFNIKDILSKAIFLKYVKVVEQTLKEDLINPSDELVKYFLSRPEIKTGARITTQMIEKHRAATAEAMRKVMGATIDLNQSVYAPIQEQRTLADIAIDIIRSVKPETECEVTEQNGIYSIVIMDNNIQTGTLRISYFRRLKCDFFGTDKNVRFFGDLEEIKNIL